MIAKSQFQTEMRSSDTATIYDKYIRSADVWLISQKSAQPKKIYQEMKEFFSEKLEIEADDVGIVGSAKLGFSLSPTKKFKDFGKDSDIDLSVVSRKHYHEIWGNLLDAFYNREFHAVGSAKMVFKKFVSLNFRTQYSSEKLKSWQREIGTVQRDFRTKFLISNEITYRIYETQKAADDYQFWSLGELKRSLK